jgi:nucleoside diphosphate kinase
MEYLQTDKDLDSGKATLVVFTPDALESQLIGSLERWIGDRTDCVPVARQRVSYTHEALRRFYSAIAARLPEDEWRLLSTFFLSGPCLATLWFGEDAAHAIPNIKGQTHPARCSASTLRGRFWCDNEMANLVHVSDDPHEVARELAVLRSLEPDLFGGPLSTQALTPFADPGRPSPRHSGILTLCSVVASLLSTRGSAFPRLDIPDNEEARQTMARAEAWLGQARTSIPLPVAGAVDSYLNGTADSARFLHALKGAVPLDPWQELILGCGLLSRPVWLEGR